MFWKTFAADYKTLLHELTHEHKTMQKLSVGTIQWCRNRINNNMTIGIYPERIYGETEKIFLENVTVTELDMILESNTVDELTSVTDQIKYNRWWHQEYFGRDK